jgi:hypothetical protein
MWCSTPASVSTRPSSDSQRPSHSAAAAGATLHQPRNVSSAPPACPSRMMRVGQLIYSLSGVSRNTMFSHGNIQQNSCSYRAGNRLASALIPQSR